MTPEKFYTPDEKPTDRQKIQMWENIQKTVVDRSLTAQPQAMQAQPAQRPATTTIFSILDRRSFYYGMAATVVLCFAMYGAYAALQQGLSAGRPTDAKLDAAYQTAIREFEKAMPSSTERAEQIRNRKSRTESRAETFDAAPQHTPQAEMFAARKEQMGMLDTEIAQLRATMRSGDRSPIMQTKLRQLYKMKLEILQDMVESGEIEL